MINWHGHSVRVRWRRRNVWGDSVRMAMVDGVRLGSVIVSHPASFIRRRWHANVFNNHETFARRVDAKRAVECWIAATAQIDIDTMCATSLGNTTPTP